MTKQNITVVGAGYVGTSLAVALSQYHFVTLLDINEEKIQKLCVKKSPIEDEMMQLYLQQKTLSLSPTTDKEKAYKNADMVIIATPTNYDENTHYFDTSSIEQVVSDVLCYNHRTVILLKSTVPVGFTNSLIEKFHYQNIAFSPEFLREGRALEDSLYPSRIVVGAHDLELANSIAMLLKQPAKNDAMVIATKTTEAEASKLLANTYLAMRVAYFNELDSFCLSKQLNVKDVINIVSSDDRIGNYYNNPSFGYGGYCLPKDSKQLLANYESIPQNLMSSIIQSNETRKKFIADFIIAKQPKMVGVYRLTMKQDSDNIRSSAIQDIIEILVASKIKVLIYEPIIKDESFLGAAVTDDLEFLKKYSDIIVSNRMSKELADVGCKVFTRDIFGEN